MIYLATGLYILTVVMAYKSLGGFTERIELRAKDGHFTGAYRTDTVRAVPTKRRLAWSALGPIGLVRGIAHTLS